MNGKMMSDELLARQLQEELDRESAEHLAQLKDDSNQSSLGQQIVQEGNGYLYPKSFPHLSPVDPSLELSDPNPNIRHLFLQFNEDYFWGQLSAVEVKWSPRMTYCAGLCLYEGDGGLCSVRLSLPLLKLRPRKDLVETLLHEMIHAYLFVTNNDRDHNAHGPKFKRHMNRINNATGANITIYHSFHEEVANYQQHWWRCNGPCQHRRPFFGYVKRAMNRAPSSNDTWWADHKATCSGTFIKIKEPDDYWKKKYGGKKNQDQNNGKDIRTFIDKGQVSSPPKNKKLFDSNGKALPFNKRNTGSIFSNGKTKNTTSANNKTSSTSNYVLVGGVLVRKPSLTQSSLFTSVGISNSAVSTKNSSHSVLSPENPGITFDSKQDKSELHHDASVVESCAEKNNYADIFHGSGTKKYDWLSRIQSSSLPNGNKSDTKLSKNFRSVCEGRGKGKGKKRRRSKKYIFDELDEDDGLWNTDSDSSPSKNCSEVKPSTTDIELLSVSPLNKKLKDTCSIANLSTSSSPKFKRDILTEIASEKLDNQISPREDQDQFKSFTPSKSETYFPVHSKSPSKTKIHPLQKTSSSKKHKTLDSFISREKKTAVPELKRSFDEAFPSVVIDVSDDEEGEDFLQQSNKRIKDRIKEEVVSQEITDGENDVLSASASTSVSQMCEQTSSSEKDGNSSLISCPVCDAKVFHYGINTHLDMCLGMM